MANIDWMSVFLNALPMLVLVGVWIYFMNRMRRGGFNAQYQTEYLAQMKAQVAALERVAAALEKRD
jgi:ATP-dependent Zn protease